MSANLVEKYAPRQLADLLGQPCVGYQLGLFCESPYPCAFLFEGGTGVGKTTAANLVAESLGVLVTEGPFGGYYQIASGEQTGQGVRQVMDTMRLKPMYGSGWRVLVVNEADAMTPGAAVIWLDALENLPPRSVVIFTTNATDRIPARLRDRCERVAFESSALLLRSVQEEMTARVWREEGCAGEPPDIGELGLADDKGQTSFRRLLQKLAPLVRAAQQQGPAPAPAPMVSRVENAPLPKAWLPADLALVGTLPDQEVARRTGRTANAVRIRRKRLEELHA